jgi:hypothetical protein
VPVLTHRPAAARAAHATSACSTAAHERDDAHEAARRGVSRVARRRRVGAAEALFIGDRLSDDVSGPQALGMLTVHLAGQPVEGFDVVPDAELLRLDGWSRSSTASTCPVTVTVRTSRRTPDVGTCGVQSRSSGRWTWTSKISWHPQHSGPVNLPKMLLAPPKHQIRASRSRSARYGREAQSCARAVRCRGAASAHRGSDVMRRSRHRAALDMCRRALPVTGARQAVDRADRPARPVSADHSRRSRRRPCRVSQ